jgi:hypothetical protein
VKKFLFLGILAVVLVLFLPVGQTQQANTANTQSVMFAEDVIFAPQTILATTARANAAEQVEQTIQMSSQANTAVDEAEQANTAEAWYHRTASGVDRGEAPVINETANLNEGNHGTRNGGVIKTCTPAQLNNTNFDENPRTTWTERGAAPINATTNATADANENTTIADVPTALLI